MTNKFVLTEQEATTYRDYLLAKARSMSSSEYVYWSWDQDGWESDLEACLVGTRIAHHNRRIEEVGEGPLPESGVCEILDFVEIEVFGEKLG